MDPRELVYLVLDTETTGIDPADHGVCQIAGVWIRKGQIIYRFESLVHPGRHIPPDASAIHHLTDKHVKDAEPLAVVLERMLTEGPSFDAWAAHNGDFDFGFVPPMDKPVLCTLRLAKKLWDAQSFSNQYLRYALKLDVPDVEGLPAHSALPDALVTARLLMLALNTAAEDFPEKCTDIQTLVAWANTPNLLEIVAFGKHKGKRWSEVDKGYLGWAKGNMTMDQDLEFTINYYLG